MIAPDFLPGGGEMEEHIRSLDWSETPIGALDEWSPALRTTLRIVLANRFPQILWWGPDYIQFYNDAYVPILGAKHPEKALAKPVRECWSEIWHILRPLIDRPFQGGPATWNEDICLEVRRHGFAEETHFTIAYSPVPDENAPGGIGGVLATVHEITGKVVSDRRVLLLRDLAARSGEARNTEEACAIAARTLAAHDKDIPFALLYLIEADRKQARLAGVAGSTPGRAMTPAAISLHSDERTSGWPIVQVLETERVVIVENLSKRFGEPAPPGPWSEPPDMAVVVPIRSNRAHYLAGCLVAGVSQRLRFDEQYRDFLELVSSQVAAAIANAREYEEEKKRAEALAEIDRAKTAFFSNVSHEFRTPLTLMLGPLEELLADANALRPKHRDQVETAHRNSLRLLKLVNSLLDFSRIEAGRIKASFAATDLAALTADLASQFRSVLQAAGVDLVVECQPLPEPVYVDREMWEKIVLNLLSNAFKFTFEGRVTVRLQALDNTAVLAVADTGTGIPEFELPHIFERFHRVEKAKGRTYEGTGIGLALVQELVKLHGGTIEVKSRVDAGSTFTVIVPFGTTHITEERIASAAAAGVSTAVRSDAFISEARTWHSRELTSVCSSASVAQEPGGRARLLIADDNSDMREHLIRLLGGDYFIEAVADGAAALTAIRERAPELVVCDVMMPVLDGFEFLHELRRDEKLREIPVILVSARAGEEARTDGISAGADDYLTKPFSAKELVARIETALNLQRVRREARAVLARLNEDLGRELAAMARMQGLSVRLIEAGELNTLLDEILDAAIEITQADKGDIQLFQNGLLHIVQQRGFTSPFLEFFGTVDHDKSVCGTALLRKERVIVEDLLASSIFDGTSALDVLLAAGVRAVQSTPLVSRSGRILGMLSTYYAVRRRPRDRDLHLIDLLARQAADLIDRNLSDETLRESEERFRTLAELGPQFIWVCGATGSLEFVNQRWTDYSGLAIDATKEIRDLSRAVHPQDQQELSQRWEKSVTDGEPLEMETRLRRADGVFRWFMIRSVPRKDRAGCVVKWFGACTDIHDQKSVEEELRRTNLDLKHFAYSASHDLQEPLRTITVYSELLAARYKETLTGEGAEYLRFLSLGASRMETLVRDLLMYVQSTQLEKPAVPEEAGEALEVALANLKVSIEASDARITFDPLPAVPVHTTHLQQLFQNLVSNAIKYRRSEAVPVVHITTRRDEEGWLFSVRDNGIGVASEYKQDIFRLFQRLHARDEYTGTGIGLALCQRIVERYHGRIWVESDPGMGSTFYFTIPA